MSTDTHTADAHDDDLAPSWVIFVPYCTREHRHVAEGMRYLREDQQRQVADLVTTLWDEQATELKALLSRLEERDGASRKAAVDRLGEEVRP